MTKAYSYLRFSTPEQSRGDSFRRQSAAARDYAELHGLELVDDSFEDLGVSAFRGKNSETGALGRFLSAVEDGVVERGSYLLVESLDRISRQIARRAVRVMEDICDAGITLVTLGDGRRYDKDSLDSDPMAFMYAYMVAIRANEESEVKARRLKSVWERKRKEAATKRLTTKCPQWLIANPAGDGFTILPERAAVVSRIFEMAAAGRGQQSIAENLNREEVPTFGRASHWQRTYIAKILNNPAVIGTLVPHYVEYVQDRRRRIPTDSVPNYYPPAVSEDLYQEVQSMRLGTASPKRGRHASRQLQNILGGLAKCPKCAGTMTRVSKGPKGGRPYLVCAAAKQGSGCTYTSVQYEIIEKTILTNLGRLADEAPRPGESGELRDKLASVQAALDTALEVEANLYMALSRSATERDRLRLREAQKTVQTIEDEKTALTAEIQAVTLTGVDAAVGRIEQLISTPEIDREAVNVELRKVLSGVTVAHDRPFKSLILHFLGSSKTVSFVFGAEALS
ncbi:MAG: recombinase family protein [Pseudorhizobium pelagicum]|uniref:recombinase family protein n=1 Tax=Pseudorhizobium pelagicum TaxID=1509405 RepID=UPI00346135C4